MAYQYTAHSQSPFSQSIYQESRISNYHSHSDYESDYPAGHTSSLSFLDDYDYDTLAEYDLREPQALNRHYEYAQEPDCGGYLIDMEEEEVEAKEKNKLQEAVILFLQFLVLALAVVATACLLIKAPFVFAFLVAVPFVSGARPTASFGQDKPNEDYMHDGDALERSASELIVPLVPGTDLGAAPKHAPTNQAQTAPKRSHRVTASAKTVQSAVTSPSYEATTTVVETVALKPSQHPTVQPAALKPSHHAAVQQAVPNPSHHPVVRSSNPAPPYHPGVRLPGPTTPRPTAKPTVKPTAKPIAKPTARPTRPAVLIPRHQRLPPSMDLPYNHNISAHLQPRRSWSEALENTGERFWYLTIKPVIDFIVFQLLLALVLGAFECMFESYQGHLLWSPHIPVANMVKWWYHLIRGCLKLAVLLPKMLLRAGWTGAVMAVGLVGRNKNPYLLVVEVLGAVREGVVVETDQWFGEKGGEEKKMEKKKSR